MLGSHRAHFARSRVIAAGILLIPLAFARPAAASVELGITTNPPLDPAQLQAYTAAAGQPPKIEMWFASFGSPLFWSSAISAVESAGATPMVTWDPMIGSEAVSFSDIATGRYDSYLESQAYLARHAGFPIYVRFAHEMNESSASTPWGPGSGNTPATFVAAWIHVVTIFRQEGATNIKWVWAPNVYCGGSCPFTAYYPGDDWVDYVGLDGYNFAATHDVRWMDLAQIFEPSYALLTAMTTKPVMFTETASTELGGDKAEWITQGFLHDIPTLFPRVVAVIWWQRIDTTNWEVNSTPESAAAWRAVAMSPYYGGPGEPPESTGGSTPPSPGGSIPSENPSPASGGAAGPTLIAPLSIPLAGKKVHVPSAIRKPSTSKRARAIEKRRLRRARRRRAHRRRPRRRS
jgi:mannan endo-1,4-beta-mannosidase